MRAKDIKQGGFYLAKVSTQVVVVRVDLIFERFDHRDRASTRWRVTNLATGRQTEFKSVQRFRQEVPVCEKCGKPFTRWAPGRPMTCLTCLEGKDRSSFDYLNDKGTAVVENLKRAGKLKTGSSLPLTGADLREQTDHTLAEMDEREDAEEARDAIFGHGNSGMSSDE